MNKIIIEVGSTNTKIDIYDGTNVKRLDEVTIPFKKNYNEKHKILEQDQKKLIDKVNELTQKYKDIYICGTSIFRDLSSEESKKFKEIFKKNTGLEFHIISQEKENELTVLGSVRNVKDKVCVFVGGGGSTEISIYNKKLVESKNTKFGVMDVMSQFPDLANDIATTPLEDVMNYIEKRLVIPDECADIMILSGGGHELFARNSGVKYEKNTLYNDPCETIMMDIDTRIQETKRYFEKISLDEIRSRVSNPDWWYATRAMCAFVLVVAKKLKVRYIVPTNISMVYGIIDEKN